jgi:hypothetical protein
VLLLEFQQQMQKMMKVQQMQYSLMVKQVLKKLVLLRHH